MILSKVSRCACSAALAAAMLAGCRGPQQAGSIPAVGGGASQNVRTALPIPGQSWIDQSAKTEDLFYVADPNNGFIRVYSLLRHKLVGLLYQTNEPNGVCVDKAGDVFVPGFNGGSIYEYGHGLKRPKAKLIPAALQSMSCSVDPSTGNLAVTTFEGSSGNAGNVAVYQQALGTPAIYSDPAIFEYFFCGYDTNGNLFVDGLAPSSAGGGFVFAELPKGSTTFTNITLNQAISKPGQVQWDGKHIAIGDQTTTNIYRFAISGSAGTLQGTTALTGATTVNDFWIHGTNVLVANAYSVSSVAYADVLFYRYPAGGTIRFVTANGKYAIAGLGVSLYIR